MQPPGCTAHAGRRCSLPIAAADWRAHAAGERVRAALYQLRRMPAAAAARRSSPSAPSNARRPHQSHGRLASLECQSDWSLFPCLPPSNAATTHMLRTDVSRNAATLLRRASGAGGSHRLAHPATPSCLRNACCYQYRTAGVCARPGPWLPPSPTKRTTRRPENRCRIRWAAGTQGPAPRPCCSSGARHASMPPRSAP